MNKIEQMLQELCPNGVEYFLFGEVCEYVRGITYNKSQEVKTANEDSWRVFRANNITLSSNTLNYEDIKLVSKSVKVKETQLLRQGDILICAGSGSKEHIGKVAYISTNMNYTFGGFMAVIRCLKKLNSRYLFYILASEMFSDYLSSVLNSSTINNLNAGIIKNFSIPVPPLPIQEEIVRILDHFTELTASLQAELQARQEQYEYYRNKLLTFTKIGGGTQSVTWMKMSEIAEICSGKNRNKSDIGTYPVYGSTGIIAYSENFIYVIPQILIARVGANAGFVHIAVGKYDVSDNTLIVSIKDGNKYYFKYIYYLLSNMQLNKLAKGGGQPLITSTDIKKLLVPIPSPDTQQRIVTILDKFETLVNDLSQGLPAEIIAVQEQYEYYRNKLLTFNCIKSN